MPDEKVKDVTQRQNTPRCVPGAGPNTSNAKFQNEIINKVKECGFLICKMGYLEETLADTASLRCTERMNQTLKPDEMGVTVRGTYNQVEENKLLCQFLDFLIFSKHFL